MPTRPDSFTLGPVERGVINARTGPNQLSPKGLTRSFVLRTILRSYERLVRLSIPSLTEKEWGTLLRCLDDVDLATLEHGEIPDLRRTVLGALGGVKTDERPSDEAIPALLRRLEPISPAQSLACIEVAHAYKSGPHAGALLGTLGLFGTTPTAS